MKRLKRAIIALLAVCIMSAGFSIMASASSAQLRFSDPSTTVGAEVEITATFTGTTSVRSMDASLKYDTSMLRFVKGDLAQDNGGTITLTGAGDGMSQQLTYKLTFQALKEGTTKIEIASASATDTSGGNMDVTKGSSTVTIGAGDPSLIKEQTATTANGPKVEVNGVAYTISNDFSEALIPVGFTKTEMPYEGQNCSVVKQDASGAVAMYLQSDSGESDFFLYNADNGEFSPFEQLELGQDRSLILLQDDGTVKVPGGYEKTTLTLNGKEFPAWQNTNNTDYYLVYGLNSDGKKELYSYDTVDGTYQRYQKPVSLTSDKTAKGGGLLNKGLQFVEDNLRIVLMLACVIFLVVLIVLIVALVKLRHRNLELDDLYDEYGIDLDEEGEEPELSKKEKKAAKKQSKLSREEEELYDFEDDDFEEFETFEEDDFDDFGEYEDEYEDSYEKDSYEDYDSYNVPDIGEEEDIDDLDELLGARVREPERRPKPKKLSHAEDDDTFKMDIIDLD